MVHIPEGLIEQFERGNALLFVGEGIHQGALPTLSELAEELAQRCDYPPDEPLTLPRVAGYYQMVQDRHSLIRFLLERFAEPGLAPLHTHELAVQLRSQVVVTTCYDRLLERALREAGIPHIPVVSNAQIAYAEAGKALLVWLWGTIDHPDSLVITEDDRRLFLEGRTTLSDVLRAELARRTWLFVGFDAEDDWFRSFYDSVYRQLDRQARRAYIVGAAPGAYIRAWWERRNADILSDEVEPFLAAMNEQLASRPPLAQAVARATREPVPDRPYKLLDYYEAKDAAIFFGRQQEELELTSLIHAHRLVLLYGASGVGKTSLLLAGVVPRLERSEPPYETIHVRALDDPELVIRQTLLRRLPGAGLPAAARLVEFLDAATQALGCTLVIILDQLEEFFLRWSPQFRASFIEEMGAVYDARDVAVKLVLSLREGWLASVNEVRHRIPEVLYVDMRLLPLSREAARQAITEPAAKLGMEYETTLVERLLDELPGAEGAAVMPPQLQLVCDALYRRARDDGRKCITCDDYEAVGTARGVLGQYLHEQLAQLEVDERSLARGVLEELVTAQRTKAVKTRHELALALAVEPSALGPVLVKLVSARLLRVLQLEEGEQAYELTHEYLVDEIELETHTRRRKQAEELVQQEFKNWQQFRTLLAADKLVLVGEVRDLLRLDADAQEFLLRSALHAEHEVESWLRWVQDRQRRLHVLGQEAGSDSAAIRRQAAKALGTQDTSEAMEVLVGLAIKDTDANVRATAGEALAALPGQRSAAVARLQAALEGGDRTTRRAILEALAMLPGRGLPLRLRLQILVAQTRPTAGWFLLWVLANGLGWSAGMFVVSYAVFAVLGVLYMLTYRPLYCGLVGLGIGLAQWSILRRRLPEITPWLVTGAVGGALGMMASVWVFEQAWETLLLDREDLALLASGAALGAVFGGFQWLAALQRRLRASGLWVLGSMVGTGLVATAKLSPSSLILWGSLAGIVSGVPLVRSWRRTGRNKLQVLLPLLSLYLGIALWGTLIIAEAQKDPVQEETVHSVPIQLLNQDEDMILLSRDMPQADVRLRARVSTLRLQQEEGILASVDLDGLHAGLSEVPVEAVLSEPSVQVLAIDPPKVTIMLDLLTETIFPVSVTISDRISLSTAYEVLTPTVRPADILVQGPASVVARISTALAPVAVGDASGTFETAAAVTLLDGQGQTVSMTLVSIVPPEHQVVDVTVPIHLRPGYYRLAIKTVTAGDPPPGYRLIGTEATPASIIAQGPPESLGVLGGVVNTAPIDVTTLRAGTIVDNVPLELPEDISPLEARTVHVRIGIEQVQDYRWFVVEPKITGLAPGLEVDAVVPRTVSIRIKGPLSVLEPLKASDLLVELDLARRRAGTHWLEPRVQVSETLSVVSMTPQVVRVTLTVP